MNSGLYERVERMKEDVIIDALVIADKPGKRMKMKNAILIIS